MVAKDHMINRKKVSIQYFKTKLSQHRERVGGFELEEREAIDYTLNPGNMASDQDLDAQWPQRSYLFSNVPNSHTEYGEFHWTRQPHPQTILGNQILPPVLSPTRCITVGKARRYKDFYSSLRRNNMARAISMADESNIVIRPSRQDFSPSRALYSR